MHRSRRYRPSVAAVWPLDDICVTARSRLPAHPAIQLTGVLTAHARGRVGQGAQPPGLDRRVALLALSIAAIVEARERRPQSPHAVCQALHAHASGLAHGDGLRLLEDVGGSGARHGRGGLAAQRGVQAADAFQDVVELTGEHLADRGFRERRLRRVPPAE